MEILKVTESEHNVSNIVYLYGGLSEVLNGAARNFSAYNEGKRSVLEIEAAGGYGELIRGEIEDKISDVIAVNYKYNFFVGQVHPLGLNEIQRGILISALISADIDEDKKYIVKKVSSENEYAVDGLFNFRLSALKRKWENVLSYIPKTFSVEQLKDFIAFIMEEKAGTRVFADKGKVYDVHFRNMRRTLLTPRVYGDDKLLNEIILSGVGEAELLSPVSEAEEGYLKEYLGDKIILGKSYFCN